METLSVIYFDASYQPEESKLMSYIYKNKYATNNADYNYITYKDINLWKEDVIIIIIKNLEREKRV